MRAPVVAASLGLLLGMACAGDPPATSRPLAGAQMAVNETGTVRGTVSIGPVRSVERLGEPNRRPYQARLRILDAAGHEVARAESDADGKFAVNLPPGTYTIRPESSGPYPRAGERRVTVRASKVTPVEIEFDSGRR